RRHPAQFGYRRGKVVDLDIGILDGPMKPLAGTPFARAVPEGVEGSLDGHLAGDFAAFVPADAIGDRKLDRIRRFHQMPAKIFIVGAVGSDVRQHRQLKRYGDRFAPNVRCSILFGQSSQPDLSVKWRGGDTAYAARPRGYRVD